MTYLSFLQCILPLWYSHRYLARFLVGHEATWSMDRLDPIIGVLRYTGDDHLPPIGLGL